MPQEINTTHFTGWSLAIRLHNGIASTVDKGHTIHGQYLTVEKDKKTALHQSRKSRRAKSWFLWVSGYFHLYAVDLGKSTRLGTEDAEFVCVQETICHYGIPKIFALMSFGKGLEVGWWPKSFRIFPIMDLSLWEGSDPEYNRKTTWCEFVVHGVALMMFSVVINSVVKFQVIVSDLRTPGLNIFHRRKWKIIHPGMQSSCVCVRLQSVMELTGKQILSASSHLSSSLPPDTSRRVKMCNLRLCIMNLSIVFNSYDWHFSKKFHTWNVQ